MRTIFIDIPTGSEVKNLLMGDFYRMAGEKKDIKLVLFVPLNKQQEYSARFSSAWCEVNPTPKEFSQKSFARGIFNVIAGSSIPTKTIYFRQYFTYKNGGSLLAFLIKRFFWLLGHSKLFRKLIRAAEFYLFRDDYAFRPWFDKYKPDAVFATALKHQTGNAMLKYAKRRGIFAVGMTGGWDNLSSKVDLRVFPDMLLVQNKQMREEAETLFGFPKDRVRVVGFPQYDCYLDRSWFMAKEEVGRRIGADPAKPWISVYSGGVFVGNLDMQDLSYHAEVLAEAVRKGELPEAEVIFRIHPLDKTISGKKIEGVRIVDFGKDFNFSPEEVKLLMNIVRLSDVTVTLASTMTLEASIFDRPLVIAGFSGPDDTALPWWRRVSVVLDNAAHYFPFEESGGVWRVRSPEELIFAVKTYLENPSLHKEGRERFREILLGPMDGRASERILDSIYNL